MKFSILSYYMSGLLFRCTQKLCNSTTISHSSFYLQLLFLKSFLVFLCMFFSRVGVKVGNHKNTINKEGQKCPFSTAGPIQLYLALLSEWEFGIILLANRRIIQQNQRNAWNSSRMSSDFNQLHPQLQTAAITQYTTPSPKSFLYLNSLLSRTNCILSQKMCIYPTFPLWTRCNTRSILNLRTVGMNSEFSFSKTGCLTKVNPLAFCLFWS